MRNWLMGLQPSLRGIERPRLFFADWFIFNGIALTQHKLVLSLDSALSPRKNETPSLRLLEN